MIPYINTQQYLIQWYFILCMQHSIISHQILNKTYFKQFEWCSPIGIGSTSGLAGPIMELVGLVVEGFTVPNTLTISPQYCLHMGFSIQILSDIASLTYTRTKYSGQFSCFLKAVMRSEHDRTGSKEEFLPL